MKKTMCLVRGVPGDTSYRIFSDRILSLVRELASAVEYQKISVTISDPPPNLSLIPLKKRKIAVISIYGNQTLPPDLLKVEGIAGSYSVEEALPIAYEKQWKDMEATPGICLLTLFRKKKNISYEVFIERWHNGHTPLSLQIHPLWHYNRNVVKEILNSASEPFDGVVEEHFRERSDLLNPIKFFGKGSNLITNMMAVYRDVKGFIDYPSIESYLVREYHIRS